MPFSKNVLFLGRNKKEPPRDKKTHRPRVKGPATQFFGRPLYIVKTPGLLRLRPLVYMPDRYNIKYVGTPQKTSAFWHDGNISRKSFSACQPLSAGVCL